MEDREVEGVERELRPYLSAQLDRIPVPSGPRFAPARRNWIRTAALVPASVLVVLIAIGAGLGLADWRAHRATPDELPASASGVPGPLALAGGAPSLAFGLVSTSANTLLVRNEITESAPFTFAPTYPQVAVSPNGHDIVYWLGLPDSQTGKPTVYQLTRSDLLDPAVRNRPIMRAGGSEAPGPVIWSSDGTGLLVGTRTPPTRGDGPVATSHASWFAIDVASGKSTELAPAFEGMVSTVYAWDRQRDLVTGSGFFAGQTTFTALRGDRITNSAIPTGAMLAAADAYGRSVVLAYGGDCKGLSGVTARCPALIEVRDQATFAVVVAAAQIGQAITDYPDVTFRPRSQDLIVQLPLQSGDAQVELWSDLGRGPRQVLATYTQLVRGTIRFTSRRELVLPRVDGSAVFLLKFDNSAGGRWFGEVVGLSPVKGATTFERTPFEILTGGNPLASVVLDPAVARVIERQTSPAKVSASPLPSGVVDPQPLIDKATRLTSIVLRVDDVAARITTMSDFTKDPPGAAPGGSPDQSIWVVAIRGDIRVDAIIDLPHAQCALFAYGAATGEVRASRSGPASICDPYFK